MANPIKDEELNGLIEELIRYLGLPPSPTICDAERGSIMGLGPREYRTAICIQKMSPLDAISCCRIFLDFSTAMAMKRGITMSDEVVYTPPLEKRRIRGGFMLFGDRAPSSTAVPSAPKEGAGDISAPPPTPVTISPGSESPTSRCP